MFGFLYTGFVALAKMISFTQNQIEDTGNHNEAKQNNETFYYDHKGAMRLVSTGEPVFHSELLSNGDHVLKSAKDFRVIRNYDAERRAEAMNKNIEKAKAEGRDAYVIGTFEKVCPGFYNKGKWGGIKGSHRVYKKFDPNDHDLYLYNYGHKIFLRIRDLKYIVPEDVSENIKDFYKKNQKMNDERVKDGGWFLLGGHPLDWI